MKVKVFTGISPTIESAVNEWLALVGDRVVIKFTQTSAAAFANMPVNSQRAVIVITIWYEETASA